ncbi:histidine kinase dimerization/phosphoacceptor domain -containing protein [uncultured Jannaschia sp.]|uniref:sensor histidine kinase n=1 Tax=uncultured Jannaschia sp. TaxID=293347 RepID=UPI0026351BC3|nr:histidine kinase dimerization/phosphoacceptor domain -containing protein [uncultured Jannaschia sp.]
MTLKIGAADLLSSLPRSFAIIDLDMIFLEASDGYLELTGRTREQLIGSHVFERFPDVTSDAASSGDIVRNSFRRVFETGRPDKLDTYYYPIAPSPDDGAPQRRWWRAENRPVFRNGRVVALIHDVEDVTADVIAQRERDVRDRLIESLSDVATWQFHPQSQTVIASAALAEMCELDGETGDVLVAPYLDRVHPDDLERVVSIFAANANAPAGTSVDFDFRVVTPQAGERWFACRSELVRSEPNAPAAFIGLSIDITEAKMREVELTRTITERDRLIEQKEVLLGEVNHRIKNSLQIVSSILKLDASHAHDENMQGRLQAAASRVQAVASVHELIYRAGQVDTVEFGEYLGDLCRAMEDSLPLEIALIHESVPLRVSTDRAISLALLVNELVANSATHAFRDRKDGTIAVRAAVNETRLELSVSDNGDGRPEAPGHRGLGTRIIAAMVSQLEAELRQFRGTQGGHVVHLSVPIDR